MEQKRFSCDGSRLPRLQNYPGGQICSSLPAPAHSLESLYEMAAKLVEKYIEKE